MKQTYENLKVKGWAFNRTYRRYREDIIEFQIGTQKSYSSHNAVIFFVFGIVYLVLNRVVWHEFRKDCLFCFGVSLLSAVNYALYKKVFPKHKNWVIPAGNIYVLILGKTLLSLSLVGEGEVSWTLLLCSLISTAMIVIVPFHYMLTMAVLLGLDMVEYLIVNDNLVYVLYNLLDDFIIAAFCIGINVIYSKMKYAEMARKENLYSESSRDHLTGLFNRRYLERYFDVHTDCNGECAILMLDLDNFKMANDIFGHKKGDEVLCRVAAILKENFRETDCVARFGGDEFIVFLPDIPKREVVMDRVERVLKRFPIVIEGDGRTVEVSVSIGVVFKEEGEMPSYTQLSEKADGAMYWAKRSGKAQAVVATMVRQPAMARTAAAEKPTATEKPAAIDKQEEVLFGRKSSYEKIVFEKFEYQQKA